MTLLSRLVMAAAVIFSVSMQSSAEPIGTRSTQCYGARWVQARGTDCDQVCRRLGMSAESMALSSASQQRIFVCRHRGRTSNTFGEQGSGNCRIIDGGTPRKESTYECLCVEAGCVAEESEETGRRPPPRRISEEACLERVEEAVRRMRDRPSREAYARARRYCAAGDLTGAIRALSP